MVYLNPAGAVRSFFEGKFESAAADGREEGLLASPILPEDLLGLRDPEGAPAAFVRIRLNELKPRMRSNPE